MPFPYVKRHNRIPIEQRFLINLRGDNRGRDPLMDRMMAVTDPDNPIEYTSNDMSSKTKREKMMAQSAQSGRSTV